MGDEELIRELHYLGIDEDSFKVVALLPLIHVGWADGRIQTAERELILETARRRGLLEGDGARVLRGWLEHPPTLEYQHRGQKLLLALARRQGHLGEWLTVATLDEIVDLCMDVAKAAGGLFGIIGRVESSEKEVLSEIAMAMDVASELESGALTLDAGEGWDDLAEELG